MWESTFILSILFCFNANAQTYNWAYSAGGGGWDDLKSTHLGNDNGTVVTGMFSSTAMFGAISLTSLGYQDAFVAKYDQQGNVLWANAIGGSTEQDWGYKVTTDNLNNVYVTGYFQSAVLFFTPTDSIVKNIQSSRNVFLAKYNSNGVFQWAKLGSAGTTNGFLTSRSVVTDNQNNVIISGDYNKELEFGATTFPMTNATNIFMVKFDASGNVIWSKTGVSTSVCWFADLIVDATNNIYATGKISTAITFGATTITNNLGDDMVVGKFDANGNLLWMKVVGKSISASTTSNDFDCGSGIKVDLIGNVFVGGSLLDTSYYDMNLNTLVTKQFAFVAKYSNTGVEQWLKKFGNDEKDKINAIALDANGDAYVIGNYRGAFTVGTTVLPPAAVTSAFVAKFNSINGATLFAYKHGTSNAEVEGWGIGVNQQNGNVYTAGIYKDACSFNANSINCQGVWDMFFVLLNNTVTPTSVNDYAEDMFAVYPNPAQNNLSITFKDGQSVNNISYQIRAIDARVLDAGILKNDRISLELLTPGNYMLQLNSKEKSYSVHFVKQ